MANRTLQDLNLIDDFLLTSALGYPEIGTTIGRILLVTIHGPSPCKPQTAFFEGYMTHSGI